MNLSLPPVLFYAIGALLIVFGTLRAYHLGWKQRPEQGAEPGAEKADEDTRSPRRGGPMTHKRHLAFGILWMVMGLFLVISTLLNQPR